MREQSAYMGAVIYLHFAQPQINFKHMKYPIFFALVLTSFMISSCGTPNSVAGFYQKHKRKDGVRNVKLPGWVIWVGGGLAYNSVKEDEVKELLRFAKKIKKMRFMLAEEASAISAEDINSFVKEIKKNQYEDLLFVQDKGTRVNMLVKNKNDKLKDIVFLVKDDEDQFVFFSMKSSIKVDDIADLIRTLSSDIFDDEDKNLPDRKKKKKKVPQA